MSRSQIVHNYIDPDADIHDALDDILDDDNSYASVSAQVTGRKSDGQLLVEKQLSEDAFELNVIQWEVSPISLQERTTVNLHGDPIVLTYPPSSGYSSSGLGGVAIFQYTKYASQTGEADIYIAAEEVTATMFTACRKGQLINRLEALRVWKHKINSRPFLGHEKGNVLCLGVGVTQVGRRPNGDHLLQQRWQFITRAGSPLSAWGAGCGGWNTWHYWKDPTSDMIPDDVWEKRADGAVKEVQHYKTMDFTTLYQYQ